MVSSEEIKKKLGKKKETLNEPAAPPKSVESSETIKYCPECDIEYGPEANFCENCGTKLKEKTFKEEVLEPEGYEGDVIVVSSNYVPGYRPIKTLGFVYGLTVRSRGLGGQIGAGIRSIAGGEIKEYVTMMEHARQEAINRMINHARELGANAIISARFDSDSISNVMQEILAYGTAVIVEKE